jgi:hypothetical protein
MMVLSEKLKIQFYKTLKDEISIEDFENWVYTDQALEVELEAEYYIALLAFNFKKRGAKYELYNLLKQYVNLGDFETYKMLEMLKTASQKTAELPYILTDCYDLYCKGYAFFSLLGLDFGLTVLFPNTADTWEELTASQQEEIIDGFSPKLEEEIKNIIYWLETEQIVLTGEKDENCQYIYTDFRQRGKREGNVIKLC